MILRAAQMVKKGEEKKRGKIQEEEEEEAEGKSLQAVLS